MISNPTMIIEPAGPNIELIRSFESADDAIADWTLALKMKYKIVTSRATTLPIVFEIFLLIKVQTMTMIGNTVIAATKNCN